MEIYTVFSLVEDEQGFISRFVAEGTFTKKSDAEKKEKSLGMKSDDTFIETNDVMAKELPEIIFLEWQFEDHKPVCGYVREVYLYKCDTPDESTIRLLDRRLFASEVNPLIE